MSLPITIYIVKNPYYNGSKKFCRSRDIEITIRDKIWVFPPMSRGEHSSDIEITLVSVQGFTCVYWRVSLTRTLTLTWINQNVDKVGTNSIFTLYFSELRTAFSSLQCQARYAHSEVCRHVPIVMRVSLTVQ